MWQVIGDAGDFAEAIAASIASSTRHPEEDGRRPLPKTIGRGPYPITVTDETALACLHGLADDGHVAALNFASATRPGGGFRGGAEAQEESLARSSALYPCLQKFIDCQYTLPLNRGLYTHSMIFSPLVPFFRTDDGGFCTMRRCSVITSSACNMKKTRRTAQGAAEAKATMRERVRRVLHLAAAERVDTLVLGAWGCGVFGGCPTEMAHIFRQAVRDAKFSHIRFIFAIPDPRMCAVFRSIVASDSPPRLAAPLPTSKQGSVFARADRRRKGNLHRDRRLRDKYEVAAHDDNDF